MSGAGGGVGRRRRQGGRASRVRSSAAYQPEGECGRLRAGVRVASPWLLLEGRGADRLCAWAGSVAAVLMWCKSEEHVRETCCAWRAALTSSLAASACLPAFLYSSTASMCCCFSSSTEAYLRTAAPGSAPSAPAATACMAGLAAPHPTSSMITSSTLICSHPTPAAGLLQQSSSSRPGSSGMHTAAPPLLRPTLP